MKHSSCPENRALNSISRWAPVARVGALLVFVGCFSSVVQWLIQTWFSSSYDQHGVFVPFLALVMVAIRRREVLGQPVYESPAGLWLAASGLFLLLIGVVLDLNLLAGAALVITLAGMFWSQYGLHIFRRLRLPLAFMMLMLPLNYPLDIFAGFPLRLIATRLTVLFLRGIGIDAIRQGTLIITPKFQLAIDAPCSGLHLLAALLMTGFFLTWLVHRRLRDSFLVLLLLAPVAVLSNAVRTSVITWLGHTYGRETAMGALHQFSGLAVFVLALILLIVFSEILLYFSNRFSRRAPSPVAGSPAPSMAETGFVPRRAFWVHAVLLVLLASVWGMRCWVAQRPLMQATDSLLTRLPTEINHIQSQDLAVSPLEYSQLLEDGGHILQRKFGSGVETLWLGAVESSAGWRSQHPPQVCYIAQGWEVQWKHAQKIQATSGKTISVESMLVKRDGHYRLMYYFYTDGRHETASYFSRIYYSLLDRALHARVNTWLLVQLSTPAERSGDEAQLSRAAEAVIDACSRR